MTAHRCCFTWRGDFWCACETCGQWPTAEQVAILEGKTVVREMVLGDIYHGDCMPWLPTHSIGDYNRVWK